MKELEGIYDPDPSKKDAFEKIKWYNTIEECLGDIHVKRVAIACPPLYHFETAKKV